MTYLFHVNFLKDPSNDKPSQDTVRFQDGNTNLEKIAQIGRKSRAMFKHMLGSVRQVVDCAKRLWRSQAIQEFVSRCDLRPTHGL